MTPEQLQYIQEHVAGLLRASMFTHVEAQPLEPPKPAEIYCTTGNEGDALVISIEPM